MNVSPKENDMTDAKSEIISEIIRVSNHVAPEPLTQRVFKRNSKISDSKLRYYFGTFNKAVQAAGLTPNPINIPVSGYQKIDDDILLKDLGRLWQEQGRRPTEATISSNGTYSPRPYRVRWGSVAKALVEFERRFPDNVPSSAPGSEVSAGAHVTKPLVIPETHKPKAKAPSRRLLFGEPIDFRGLRYAPINEQGVVYLFGMVSRELGFLIESVRTDFPDSEGKRCTSLNGTTWEHVRIEFEYKSSNFNEHGHDPEQCDLIVCWLHDWAESPLEVLELKSELRKLSSK
ncbi:MAG: hypothetical protein AB1306_02155 [Nitrospirota bacterium]